MNSMENTDIIPHSLFYLININNFVSGGEIVNSLVEVIAPQSPWSETKLYFCKVKKLQMEYLHFA